MIYLDNAATSGQKPDSVIRATYNSMKYLSANPGRSGHNLSVKAAEKIFEVRQKVSTYFNSDGPEQVAFLKNCTEALNTVIKCAVKTGSHIITTDFEHNAVMRPLTKCNAEYTAVNVSLNNPADTLKNIENSIKENTEMILVTAASNVLGTALPLKEIGDIAKKHNLTFALDGAQGGGILPIDMKEMNIDFLCLAPHKGLFAMMGTGILIARKKINDTLIEGGTGTDSVNFAQPDIMPEMLESGTVNLPGIVSIGEGINFLNNFDKEIYTREMKYTQRMYEALSNQKGILLYTPYPEFLKAAPVLSFNIDGVSSQVTGDILNKNGIAVRPGLHCAPTAHKKIGTLSMGTVRISPGFFNSLPQIDKAIKVIEKISENRKKYIE